MSRCENLHRKKQYKKKYTRAFGNYATIEKFGDLEEELWCLYDRSSNIRSACSHLRNRYHVLHMTSGILRSESLYRAELSDFMGVTLKDNQSDIHQMFVMINQIAIGKTNHGRTLYGRATRHKDVRLCCIGAFSFYIQFRIFLTGELQSLQPEDWLNNRKWFDIKLLADTLVSKDHTEQMQNSAFSKILRKVLVKLELPTDKLLHLGRNVGPKILDLLEAEVEDIRRNPSILDSCYSTKLPNSSI
jgi:hypothetical protein